MAKKPTPRKTVESLRHSQDKRKNIPTAEHRAVVSKEQEKPLPVKYPRNRDLDPQLVWHGKDKQDLSDLLVQAPPLYIQEKVHPKVLIDDLLRHSKETTPEPQLDLFADFNGMPKDVDRTEFYQHDQNWTNRMILGDSLQVMASLAEREKLRGKVQCIYVDPPYGIRFNSNFQWSTTSRDVKDGHAAHITREPEQVKAFRDTWRDGIHSYLTYLRDRLMVARDLLTESGSIFVQIGDENLHHVRELMDEVFGATNLISQVTFTKTTGATVNYLAGTTDFILWYGRDSQRTKYRPLHVPKEPADFARMGYGRLLIPGGERRSLSPEERAVPERLPPASRVYSLGNLQSQSIGREKGEGAACWFPVSVWGRVFKPTAQARWKTNEIGMSHLGTADRLEPAGNTLRYVRFVDDFPVAPIDNLWSDTGVAGFTSDKRYVVETSPKVVQRCVLMTTDPGDLVLDPTCGSGTTACVAEQWGRRWITIDTSRVALALARARIMGARYPFYLLADSPEGQRKEAELAGRASAERPSYGNIRHGFVYERVPHVTLKSIAQNAEIDVIYEKRQPKVKDALARLNGSLRGHKVPFRVTTGGREGQDVGFDAPEKAIVTMPSGEVVPAYALVEWEVPREAPADWPVAARKPLAEFLEARVARQKEIDASIEKRAEYEFLYDKPYEDKRKVRVAGPFTVESLSPHRALGVDENDELIDPLKARESGPPYGVGQTFEQMILENLQAAGVQQAHKEDRITFTALVPWPGERICAEGRYREGNAERRAGIFIGPEFGTVQRQDLVEATHEAADAGFDVLISCAFNYEAHATELMKIGRIRVLKARMNADLHMAGELKSTGKGNLFVIFGEPDVRILEEGDGRLRVKIQGVDVFDPSTGEIRSDDTDKIACWFVDTEYNEESFFVRHAYFLGQNDPYSALKTTLRAEVKAEAWATLHSDTSRPFDRPKSKRIAVKVINHLGDEVMKVFKV